jgi:DNA-binding NarL/FixJ family response regulator
MAGFQKMDKILIVDDDRGLQSLLSDVLKLEGYEAIVAGDGREALEKIKMHLPDLILLDIRLPKMDGIKVLEEIKKIDKNLIVIMLTGYGDIKDAVKAMKLGAFDYITKPFKNEEMVINIKKALQKRHLSREVEDLKRSLTQREKEILSWLKNGKSSWDISVILGIRERTVNFHIDNIKQKLNATSRTQAVAIAVENELIDI